MNEKPQVQSKIRRWFLAKLRHPRSKLSHLSLAKHNPALHSLPDLPTELWLVILRLASSSSTFFSPSQSPHAVSFLDFPHAHDNFALRNASYQRSISQKLLFTQVCKAWHAYTQELLLEFVWISKASQASALAALLASNPNKGVYILRLHIETLTFGRCCPNDIMTILANASRLVVYSDYRSIRRPSPASSNSPQLLDALAQPGTGHSLRRLSWTNYSTLEGGGEDNVSFCLRMSPLLTSAGIAANLEFLELTFCSTHLQSMLPKRPRTSTSALLPSNTDCPSLTSTQTTDAPITLSLPALRSLKVTLDNATFLVLATWDMPILAHLSVLSSDFSYSLHPNSGNSPSGFAQFFIMHGAKLTQLELGHSSATIEEHYLTAPTSAYAPNAGAGDDEYEQGGLATWCPNLTEFICSADAEWNWQNPDWIAPHVLLPSHPSIQFIGIRDLDKRLRDDMELASGRGGDEDEQGWEFFMLMEQIGSMVRREAFPSLMYIRDLSLGSDLMRKGIGFGDHGALTMTKTISATHGSISTYPLFSVPFKFGTGKPFSSVMSSRPSTSSNSQSTPVPQSSSQLFTRNKKSKPNSTHASGHGLPALSPETKKILRFWKGVLERCANGGVCVEDWRGGEVRMVDLRSAEAGARAEVSM